MHTMWNMNSQIHTDLNKSPIEGFGERLKEERKRLKYSQTQLGEIGGVARLAQLQYEAEATSPTIRYITAIGEAGVDVTYLLFGVRFPSIPLAPEKMDRIEERAFEWVEAAADKQPNGKLDAQTRRFLVRVVRNILVQMEQGSLPKDTDVGSLIAFDVASSRGR